MQRILEKVLSDMELRNYSAATKKQYLRESVGDVAIGLMAGIKAVFDPKGLLNPGKICSDL